METRMDSVLMMQDCAWMVDFDNEILKGINWIAWSVLQGCHCPGNQGEVRESEKGLK